MVHPDCTPKQSGAQTEHEDTAGPTKEPIQPACTHPDRERAQFLEPIYDSPSTGCTLGWLALYTGPVGLSDATEGLCHLEYRCSPG